MRIRSKAFLVMRDTYLREHAPALFRPGVRFSPEQEAKVRELVAAGKTLEAQRIVLSELEAQTGRKSA